MFFADNAVYLFRVGEAMVLVYDGKADDALFFLFQGKVRYGPGGAHLPAEVAIVFAISQAGHNNGHEESIKSCSEIVRIKGTPQTDFHTFAAADAFLLEVIIIDNTGGSKQSF